MTVDASTLAPSVDGVAAAIEGCCAAELAQELALITSIGMGISDYADAAKECCDAQIAANEVVIPPSTNTTTVTDDMGNTTTTTTMNPGFTGPSWAYQGYAAQTAMDNQTGTYAAQYAAYLAQLDDWRQQQQVPIVAALLLNLAQVLEQLELYNDMLDCTNDLLDCVKEEVNALKDLSTNTLIPAVASHTDAVMGKFASAAALTAICDQRDAITTRSTTMWDCFESTYKPELTQYLADFSGEMFSHGAAGSEQQIELRDLNRLMFECFEDYIKPEDEATAGTIGAAIRQMAEKTDEACDWLMACADKLEGHWDTTYAQKDADYACAAMETATAALEGMQEVKTFLNGCRDAWKAIHTDIYHAGEAQHVPKIHEAACATVGKFDEIAQCALDCAEDEKARYVTTYEAKEDALSVLAMSEACDLHPCFATIKDWLVEHSDTIQGCWEDGWKGKDVQYACDLIEKGIQLLCDVDDELEELCLCAEEFKTHWENCYKDAECITMPKLIMSAADACDKQKSTYMALCDQSEHLWSKFEQTWCPWDVQDAQYFCDFWLKTNPLNELCDNHECQQELADLLKECYEDLILPWEKAYIQEICELEKYIAKYCETEDRAQLGIIAQATKARERAIKSNPRYCSGATKQQLINIDNQSIRSQAAAIQAANRDERWWETQECDRRHRYTMDVLERLGKRIPDHALQFYAASSDVMDSILGRMHERLLRGYEYVRNTNDYSRSVLNANQAAIEAGQRAVQLGQFYPDAYLRGKDSYFRHSEVYMANVQETIKLGQFYPELASRDQERALSSVNNSANWGFQHMQHGIRHVQTALDAKKVSADTAQAAQQNALQSYAIGQDYLRLALAASQEATAQTQLSLQAGSGAQGAGIEYAKEAANKMESVMQAALQSIREGNTLMGNNRLYAAQLQSGYNSVVGNGLAGFSGFLDSQRLGLETARLSGGYDQVSLNAAMNNMTAACDFLSRNHCCTAQEVSGGGQRALSTATGILSGAAGGVSSGVDGVLGSLAALNQPPGPPPVPFGNSAAGGFFGSGGGSFGSGIFL